MKGIWEGDILRKGMPDLPDWYSSSIDQSFSVDLSLKFITIKKVENIFEM